MSNKFIIIWDAGYGESAEVIEVGTLEEAEMMAYQNAKEDFESNSDHRAVPYTEEMAEEYGVE